MEEGDGSAAVTKVKRQVENKFKKLVLPLKAISEIYDGLCNQIYVLESSNQDATKIWLLLSSVLQMVQSSGATCKKIGRIYEWTSSCSKFLEVQNLDPTLAIPEKISSIITSGELKHISAIDLPLEKISHAAMVHEENLSSTSALSFCQKLSTKMPQVSMLAMKASERSFSTPYWILNSKQSCQTEENLQYHLQLVINQNQHEESASGSDKDW